MQDDRRDLSSPAPQRLSQAAAGSRVRLETLPSHPGLKDRLLALGIRPGVRLDVLRRGRPGGILHLAHGMLEFMLRREHAEQMTVRHEPEDPGGGAEDSPSPIRSVRS